MRAKYNTVLAEAKQRYRERVRDGDIKAEGEALAILTFIRIAAAPRPRSNTPWSACAKINEQGSKVVVFSAFREPVLTTGERIETRSRVHRRP